MLRQHVSILLQTIFRPKFISKRYNQCVLCILGYHITYNVNAKTIKNIKIL